MTRLAVALLLIAAVAGCRANSGPAGRPAAGPNVWATVNDREITRDDVEKAFRREAAAEQRSDEETLGGKLELLNQLIVQEMLLAKARELKIELTDTELDTAFNEAKKNIS